MFARFYASTFGKNQHRSALLQAAYAFALHLSGQPQEAAGMLDQLGEELRKSPGIAPFCALIYAASGDRQRAEKYRRLPHQPFFPQEKTLVANSAE